MKKELATIAVFCFLLAICACSDTRKTTSSVPNTPALGGTWELRYISGPRIAFDGLYPDKKPRLVFSDTAAAVTGHTGCNNLRAPVRIDNMSMLFGDPITTRMACPGIGEATFLNTLKKVNRYSMSDDTTLTLIMGDIAIMRFTRLK